MQLLYQFIILHCFLFFSDELKCNTLWYLFSICYLLYIIYYHRKNLSVILISQSTFSGTLCIMLFNSQLCLFVWSGIISGWFSHRYQVLSVVAQQILSILSALAAGSTRFVFEGREINLVWSCGIFITMNPGKYVCTLLLRGNSTDVYDNVNNSLLPWGQFFIRSGLSRWYRVPKKRPNCI